MGLRNAGCSGIGWVVLAALRPVRRVSDYLNSSISKSVFLLVAKIEVASQGHAFVSDFFEQFGGIGI